LVLPGHHARTHQRREWDEGEENGKKLGHIGGRFCVTGLERRTIDTQMHMRPKGFNTMSRFLLAVNGWVYSAFNQSETQIVVKYHNYCDHKNA